MACSGRRFARPPKSPDNGTRAAFRRGGLAKGIASSTSLPLRGAEVFLDTPLQFYAERDAKEEEK